MSSRFILTSFEYEDGDMTLTLQSTGTNDPDEIRQLLGVTIELTPKPGTPFQSVPLTRHHYQQLAARPCNDPDCPRPHGWKIHQ